MLRDSYTFSGSNLYLMQVMLLTPSILLQSYLQFWVLPSRNYYLPHTIVCTWSCVSQSYKCVFSKLQFHTLRLIHVLYLPWYVQQVPFYSPAFIYMLHVILTVIYRFLLHNSTVLYLISHLLNVATLFLAWLHSQMLQVTPYSKQQLMFVCLTITDSS